ncbi:MAG: carboxypeptidase-like regulatory domain-containing protein [Bacteroidia bacterium]
MMNQNFISIDEPCHQGWQNMSVSDKGKFCSSCKKHVHDFSNSTLDDIRAAYIENNGDLCGHIPVTILREQYQLRETKQRHFSYLKTFCLAAILCFGANLFTIDSAKAGTLQTIKKSFFSFVSDNNKDSIIIRGEVKDKDTHKAIPYAEISAYSNDEVIYQTKANANGEYELKVAKDKYSKIDIEAVFIGYESHRMKGIMLAINKQIVVDIDIEKYEMMLDGKVSMPEK